MVENHLTRYFHADEKGQKWVSDITYIPIKQGWVYLTIIMDLYDRKIIGWALSSNMTTQTTTLADWKMAIGNIPPIQRLLFHSDRGVQYAEYAFTDQLKQNNVKQSISQKGNCRDNAVAENFFKMLKSEFVKHSNFNNNFQAKMEMFEFIEIWYNRFRKHKYLGYKILEQFGKFNYSK